MSEPRKLNPCGNPPHDKYGYVLLHREKKGKRYTERASFDCSGQSCLATAEEHCEKELGWPEDTLWHSREYRLVDRETWRQMQVRYHLKDVGQ